MSEPQLFSDLFCLIAEKLCEEPHSPSDTKKCLLSLSLASRDMYQIATPLLYREIRLIGNPLNTLCCFQTLLQNDLASASVKTLRVHNLFNGSHIPSGHSLGPSTLIPLFSDTLRRLNNLTSLYFHPIPELDSLRGGMTELFESKYPFSLRVIRIDLHSTYPAVMGFVNRQSDLRDLGFMKFSTLEASSFRLPALERVVSYLSWANNEAITTFLRNHPQLKHAALRIYPGIFPHVLQSMITRILKEANSLTSLRCIFKSSEDLAIALDLGGDPVWSSSLRLLQMSVSRCEVDVLSILFCINPVLRGKFPNLEAMWFDCPPPPAMNASFMVSKVEGPTWDFYFESSGQIQLARCEKGKDRWMIEQIESGDILAVRDKLSSI